MSSLSAIIALLVKGTQKNICDKAGKSKNVKGLTSNFVERVSQATFHVTDFSFQVAFFKIQVCKLKEC